MLIIQMLLIQMLIAKLYVKYKVKCFYKANVIFKVDCTKLILLEHVVLNGFYTKHSNVILIHIYLYNFVDFMPVESNKILTLPNNIRNK